MTENKKWQYGTAGDRYVMEHGEGFALDKSTFICGDLQDEDHFVFLYNMVRLGFVTNPDMMYVDPPWNQSNHSSFFTKAGVERVHTFEHLMGQILTLAELIKGFSFIETGAQSLDYLLGKIDKSSLILYGQWNITYYKKKPCHLLMVSSLHDLDTKGISFEGMDDEDTPLHAFTTFKPKMVLDPCAGQGLIPLSAFKAGAYSLSNELNKRRLAVAVEKLIKAGDVSPMLIKCNYSTGEIDAR